MAKYGDPYSEFVLCIYPYKVHTHSSEHTYTVNTHPEQWAAIYAAAPGEQLGVRCLAQGHLSRGIEGGESAVHSLPPPTIPAGPETRTRNLWDTSPTLQPLGHDFPRHLGSSWLRPTLQYSRWQQCTLLLDVERQKKRSSRLLYTCICCFRKKQYAFFMEFRILWPNLHNLRTDFWWGIMEKKHCPH